MIRTILITDMQEKYALEPLVKLCARRRGVKSQVLRRMMQAGVPGNWSNLSSWMQVDPSKRRVPRPSTLKSLLEIYEEVKREGAGTK